MRVRSAAWWMIAGVLAISGVAYSQEPSDPLALAWTDRARSLYNEGRNLYASQEWEKAHAAFAAAWGVKKHWQIGAMMGHCEMMLGRYRDAAEHFAWALRVSKGAPGVDEVDAMQVGLERARARVAAMMVQVDEKGAEVLVDGAAVGVAPLADPLFMEPGEHRFEARASGHTPVSTAITLGPGSSQLMVLRFSDGAAQVTRTEAPRPAEPEQRGEPISARMATIVAGAGLSAIALGVGIGFTIKKSNAQSDANDILTNLNQTYGAGPPGPCVEPQAAPSECAKLKDAYGRRDDARTIANGAWIALGVTGAITAATAVSYWIWPSKRSSSGGAGARLVPTPGGFLLMGGF